MIVFISWSGSISEKLASALSDWLPSVLQFVKPYYTPSDIEKGTRWSGEIAVKLNEAKVGIFCVTRDNTESSWLLFEAGALSKSVESSYVCPILFGIESSDLKGPLSQFQATQFKKDDFKKLIKTINNSAPEGLALDNNVVESVFEKWWPDLESNIEKILATKAISKAPVRSDRELLEEILELTRSAQMRAGEFRERPDGLRIPSGAIRDLIEQYIHMSQILMERDTPHDLVLARFIELKNVIEFFATKLDDFRPGYSKYAKELRKIGFSHDPNSVFK